MFQALGLWLGRLLSINCESVGTWLNLNLGFWGSGVSFYGLEFRVWEVEFRAPSLQFSVQDTGCRVEDLSLRMGFWDSDYRNWLLGFHRRLIEGLGFKF